LLPVMFAADPQPPLTAESIDAGTKSVLDRVREIHQKNDQLPQAQARAEDNEFNTLDAYFAKRGTVSQIKEWANSVVQVHDAKIHELKDDLQKLKKVLETPNLQDTDRRQLQKAIERFDQMLEIAQEAKRISIKKCGAAIRDAEEHEPQRARWQQLKAKRQAVEAAGQVAKEAIKGGPVMVIGEQRREGRSSY